MIENVNYEIAKFINDEFDLKMVFELDDGNLWLTKKQIALLFEVNEKEIEYRIKKIFQHKELERLLTTKKIKVVKKEEEKEVLKNMLAYNLDVLILVGYRVKSDKGTKFRKRVTKILSEYLLKGFTVNETKLIKSNECFNEFKKDVANISNSIIDVDNNFNV